MAKLTVNDRIAILGTKVFGNMGTFYVFAVIGVMAMLPWTPAALKQFLLLFSSAFLQLAALPLLAVGSEVTSRAANKRALEDHKALQVELKLLRDEMDVLRSIDAKVSEILALHEKA